ncbi:MAG: hypothetical protein JSS93_12950 [Bacteroidetes bacterium]|nr:hypothetical protein [Bacteroidota bacterium]
MASSTAHVVRKKVEKMQPGEVFAYSNFNLDKSEELSLAKSLSRLTKEGAIVRLAKGKYYKPKNTLFGKLRPSESTLVDALTKRNNQRIGYLTGISVYNRLGLTSQISNTLVIATNKPLPPKLLEGYKVKYVRREFDIRDQDIPLLQILDAIRDIKSIPDSSPDETLKVLVSKIKELPEEDRNQIVKLALNYNAATRSLLGAMLQRYVPRMPINKLAESLNVLSSYEIGVSENILPNKSDWNIK